METESEELFLESYVMPNAPIYDSTPLTAFQVPLEFIERASGLLFFDELTLNCWKSVNGRNLLWV